MFPTVSVAVSLSHGSPVLIGPLTSETSVRTAAGGMVYEAPGPPGGAGASPLPTGEMNGWWMPPESAHTR